MDRNLDKYRALLAAAELGNITRAAESLSYTQSSVSKMIADLENEWQITVLDRSRAGVCLTPDGEELLPYLRQLMNACRQLDNKAGEISGLMTGSLRIGVFSSVAEHWMPGIIAAFHRDYPKIRYELLTGDYREIEKWIRDGRVDCGFLRLPVQESLEMVSLAKDPYYVVLPKEHPLCRKSAIDPADLDGQPFLLLEHGGRTEVTEFLEKYHVTPDIRYTTWDDFAIMAMAESGQGIGLLPGLILRRVPYEVEIRPLSVDYHREIGIAFRSRESLSVAARKFLTYLPMTNENMSR